jgi:hypothetical protein
MSAIQIGCAPSLGMCTRRSRFVVGLEDTLPRGRHPEEESLLLSDFEKGVHTCFFQTEYGFLLCPFQPRR